MLHFVAGVYNSIFSTPEYNVLIVGRECAGKSTLLEQLKFLYTPATQQREEEQVQAERRAAEASPPPQRGGNEEAAPSATGSPSERTLESSTTVAPRPPLPPGTPLRATAAYMAQKRIRPTVGLNYAVIQHRFSPPVAVVTKVRKAELHVTNVASLPPPPVEVIAEQRARQQALLANAPSDAVSRVVLRDLGGQTALRDLWEKYYTQTQALVYVVDSTLPFRVPSVKSSPSPQSSPSLSPPDHFTKKELEELYKPDRQLLAKLLQHPLLEGVPVLLLSNKTDATPHLPLSSVQDAMQLADLAANRAFYVQDQADGEASESDTHADGYLSTSEETRPPLSRHCARAAAVQRRVGESGFGEVAMRILEISAVDGAGVAGAMDWLVAQVLHHARNVNADA